MSTCIVEVAGPHNEALRFRPLQRNVRGRLDWSKFANPEAHRLATQYGGLPIPGQYIGFDDEKQLGLIIEPLHLDEHAAVAEKITAKGFKLPPEREEFRGIDVNTWSFWVRQALDCGLARIVQGKLPEAIDAKAARRDFIFAPREPGTADKLADAINRMADAQAAQTAVLERLLKVLSK